MQSRNQSYISEDLCIAPEYHLVKNTHKQLPLIEPDIPKSEYLNFLAEISAIQIFEDIPGIEKTRVTIDAKTLLEIWAPIPDRILLTEDLEFLKADNQRIEAVVEKLTWLGNCWLSSEIMEAKIKVETWKDVLNVILECDYIFDFIAINYHAPKIVLETRLNQSNELDEYWSYYPICWEINLIKTRSFNGGYVIDDYNTPYKFTLEIWAGIPFIRNIKTGKLVTI